MDHTISPLQLSELESIHELIQSTIKYYGKFLGYKIEYIYYYYYLIV